MRYKQPKYCSLLFTIFLVTYCAQAVPKKKRVVIHVPETVKHIHHHITKKVPLPIVVFTKNPKELKQHPYNEYPYKEHVGYSANGQKDSYYPSVTVEEPHHISPGYEGEVVAESNYVTRELRDEFGSHDIQMARGVVADFHEVRAKRISDQELPTHLTPPHFRSKGKSLDTTTYWTNHDRDQYDYGTFKIYNPPGEQFYEAEQEKPLAKYKRPLNKYEKPAGVYGKPSTNYEKALEDYEKSLSNFERPTLLSDHQRPTYDFHTDDSHHNTYATEKPKKKKKKRNPTHRTPHTLDYNMASSKSSTSQRLVPPQGTHANNFIEEDFRRTYS